MSPWEVQVGGSHYKQHKLQPYEFFVANNVPHQKASIIRRILRYDHATGHGLTDLNKILHEVELIKNLSHYNVTVQQRVISVEEFVKTNEIDIEKAGIIYMIMHYETDFRFLDVINLKVRELKRAYEKNQQDGKENKDSR